MRRIGPLVGLMGFCGLALAVSPVWAWHPFHKKCCDPTKIVVHVCPQKAAPAKETKFQSQGNESGGRVANNYAYTPLVPSMPAMMSVPWMMAAPSYVTPANYQAGFASRSNQEESSTRQISNDIQELSEEVDQLLEIAKKHQAALGAIAEKVNRHDQDLREIRNRLQMPAEGASGRARVPAHDSLDIPPAPPTELGN